VCRNLLALPSLIGRKSEKEKFAGAEYTVSMEFYMPNGRAIQGPDFHHDGQKFARAYDINFLDEHGKKQFVYQNTFAITTRMLGVMFAVHSDEKGLILPPNVAPYKVVIVPIFNDENKKDILKEARKIEGSLKSFDPILDDDDKRPGFKFNEYELKGIPVRVEIGPKDLAKKQAVVVRRDKGVKRFVKVSKLKVEVAGILEDIQENLLRKAEKMISAKSPYDLLEEDSKTKHILKRYEEVNSKYQYLFKKAKENIGEKLIFFQYGGTLSLSSNIANQLKYEYPDKIIAVAYINDDFANISLRGNVDVRKLTLLAIKDIEGASGGGHTNATGAKMTLDNLPIFKAKIEELMEKEDF